MLISFIVLTWNSEKYIEDCISSVIEKCETEKIDYEVLAVDNGSTDKTKDILRKYSDKIAVIWLERNYGTTYPRNLAIKKAKGNIICFLDSDAVLKKGDLKSVCQRLLLSDDIGILAPKLVLANGSIQRSIKKFPSLWHKLFKFKKVLWGIEPKRNEHYEKLPLDKEVTVDHAISACWFFRKELTGIAGLLDERIFYSPEDIDYCLRTWKIGKSVLYYPFFEVIHHTQQMTYRKQRRFILLSHAKGLLYYFLKHKYLFKSPKYGEWEYTSKI